MPRRSHSRSMAKNISRSRRAARSTPLGCREGVGKRRVFLREHNVMTVSPGQLRHDTQSYEKKVKSLEQNPNAPQTRGSCSCKECKNGAPGHPAKSVEHYETVLIATGVIVNSSYPAIAADAAGKGSKATCAWIREIADSPGCGPVPSAVL